MRLTERMLCEALDAECRRLGVSSRALAAEAGISESTLSRYRTGLRTPGEKTIDALASALAALSGGAEASDEVTAHLRAPLERRRQDDVALCRRMDALMAEAGLTSSDLARVARVDPSYISRIRSGVRVPRPRRPWPRPVPALLRGAWRVPMSMNFSPSSWRHL